MTEGEETKTLVRPCPPTKPATYVGTTLNLDQVFTTAEQTASTGDVAWLTFDQSTDINKANKMGWLAVNLDFDTTNGQSAATSINVSHVFGRLGQGADIKPLST